MKNKILAVANIVMFAAAIMGLIFFVKSNIECDKNKQSLQSLQQTTSESETNNIVINNVSTADEIAALQLELSRYENMNIETENEIKQTAVNYINERYNYEGSFSKNKKKILENLKDYVADDYLQQVESSMSVGIGNHGAKESKKKVDNYCNLEDVYYTYASYDDGSDLYMMICECHISDDYTMYREISIGEYDGVFKVNYDSAINTGG